MALYVERKPLLSFSGDQESELIAAVEENELFIRCTKEKDVIAFVMERPEHSGKVCREFDESVSMALRKPNAGCPPGPMYPPTFCACHNIEFFNRIFEEHGVSGIVNLVQLFVFYHPCWLNGRTWTAFSHFVYHKTGVLPIVSTPPIFTLGFTTDEDEPSPQSRADEGNAQVTADDVSMSVTESIARHKRRVAPIVESDNDGMPVGLETRMDTSSSSRGRMSSSATSSDSHQTVFVMDVETMSAPSTGANKSAVMSPLVSSSSPGASSGNSENTGLGNAPVVAGSVHRGVTQSNARHNVDPIVENNNKQGANIVENERNANTSSPSGRMQSTVSARHGDPDDGAKIPATKDPDANSSVANKGGGSSSSSVSTASSSAGARSGNSENAGGGNVPVGVDTAHRHVAQSNVAQSNARHTGAPIVESNNTGMPVGSGTRIENERNPDTRRLMRSSAATRHGDPQEGAKIPATKDPDANSSGANGGSNSSQNTCRSSQPGTTQNGQIPDHPNGRVLAVCYLPERPSRPVIVFIHGAESYPGQEFSQADGIKSCASFDVYLRTSSNKKVKRKGGMISVQSLVGSVSEARGEIEFCQNPSKVAKAKKPVRKFRLFLRDGNEWQEICPTDYGAHSRKKRVKLDNVKSFNGEGVLRPLVDPDFVPISKEWFLFLPHDSNVTIKAKKTAECCVGLGAADDDALQALRQFAKSIADQDPKPADNAGRDVTHTSSTLALEGALGARPPAPENAGQETASSLPVLVLPQNEQTHGVTPPDDVSPNDMPNAQQLLGVHQFQQSYLQRPLTLLDPEQYPLYESDVVTLDSQQDSLPGVVPHAPNPPDSSCADVGSQTIRPARSRDWTPTDRELDLATFRTPPPSPQPTHRDLLSSITSTTRNGAATSDPTTDDKSMSFSGELSPLFNLSGYEGAM